MELPFGVFFPNLTHSELSHSSLFLNSKMETLHLPRRVVSTPNKFYSFCFVIFTTTTPTPPPPQIGGVLSLRSLENTWAQKSPPLSATLSPNSFLGSPCFSASRFSQVPFYFTKNLRFFGVFFSLQCLECFPLIIALRLRPNVFFPPWKYPI